MSKFIDIYPTFDDFKTIVGTSPLYVITPSDDDLEIIYNAILVQYANSELRYDFDTYDESHFDDLFTLKLSHIYPKYKHLWKLLKWIDDKIDGGIEDVMIDILEIINQTTGVDHTKQATTIKDLDSVKVLDRDTTSSATNSEDLDSDIKGADSPASPISGGNLIDQYVTSQNKTISSSEGVANATSTDDSSETDSIDEEITSNESGSQDTDQETIRTLTNKSVIFQYDGFMSIRNLLVSQTLGLALEFAFLFINVEENVY